LGLRGPSQTGTTLPEFGSSSASDWQSCLRQGLNRCARQLQDAQTSQHRPHKTGLCQHTRLDPLAESGGATGAALADIAGPSSPSGGKPQIEAAHAGQSGRGTTRFLRTDTRQLQGGDLAGAWDAERRLPRRWRVGVCFLVAADVHLYPAPTSPAPSCVASVSGKPASGLAAPATGPTADPGPSGSPFAADTNCAETDPDGCFPGTAPARFRILLDPVP